MTVLTPIHKIYLHSGSNITIPDFSWQEFEDILEELGEKRNIQLAYSSNENVPSLMLQMGLYYYIFLHL